MHGGEVVVHRGNLVLAAAALDAHRDQWVQTGRRGVLDPRGLGDACLGAWDIDQGQFCGRGGEELRLVVEVLVELARGKLLALANGKVCVAGVGLELGTAVQLAGLDK